MQLVCVGEQLNIDNGVKSDQGNIQAEHQTRTQSAISPANTLIQQKSRQGQEYWKKYIMLKEQVSRKF